MFLLQQTECLQTSYAQYLRSSKIDFRSTVMLATISTPGGSITD